jgi:glyoxylase-like metal-dependent hydrolase (beta-lactamase superfamily II)
MTLTLDPQLGFALGTTTIQRIVEQVGPFFDGKTFFPDLTDAMLDEHRSWLEPRYFEPGTGKVILMVQSYLVRTPHHTILIDSCVGNDKPRPTRPHWHMMQSNAYERNLASAGIAVSDIDFVMCTHLHGDHVGWNTRLDNGRWVPTFPNARYLLSERELDYWVNRHAADPASCPWIGDSVLPIVEAQKVERVKSDHALSDVVSLMPTPGHTLDHFAVRVGTPGHDAIITGDMMHSPLQVRYPELGMFVDHDGKKAGATRRKVFSHVCDTSTVLCTNHFNAPSMGRITRWDDGFRFVET